MTSSPGVRRASRLFQFRGVVSVVHAKVLMHFIVDVCSLLAPSGFVTSTLCITITGCTHLRNSCLQASSTETGQELMSPMPPRWRCRSRSPTGRYRSRSPTGSRRCPAVTVGLSTPAGLLSERAAASEVPSEQRAFVPNHILSAVVNSVRVTEDVMETVYHRAREAEMDLAATMDMLNEQPEMTMRFAVQNPGLHQRLDTAWRRCTALRRWSQTHLTN